MITGPLQTIVHSQIEDNDNNGVSVCERERQ